MKKFLVIILTIVMAFASAICLVGCDKSETPDNSTPPTVETPEQKDDGSGDGNSSGKPIITPDGEGIQFPLI